MVLISTILTLAITTLLHTRAQGAPTNYGSLGYEHVDPGPVDFATRNFNTIKTIYHTVMYPNFLPVLNDSSKLPPNIFAPDISGRISPVGNFTSLQDSIEYFFGLSPQPETNPSSSAFTSFEFAGFSSECANVASSTVYLNATVADKTKPNYGQSVSLIKQIGLWHFDSQGRVDYYDHHLIQLAGFSSAQVGATPQVYLDQHVQNRTIEDICNQQAGLCTGANQQYSSPKECMSVLHNKNFGTYDETWSDSVICRSVHLVLASYRPQIHCPHVGPTGGMKCVDYPYKKQLFDDVGLFGKRDLFFCPGKKYGPFT